MAGGSSNAATFITCVKEIFKLEEVMVLMNCYYLWELMFHSVITAKQH